MRLLFALLAFLALTFAVNALGDCFNTVKTCNDSCEAQTCARYFPRSYVYCQDCMGEPCYEDQETCDALHGECQECVPQGLPMFCCY
mmetsp:Transcript_20780/g.18185  ORF Transcript_20780/g.18185 Transcript_20780/m.18185 type:complete len:87 (-) Transcript_20780:142-402(-)